MSLPVQANTRDAVLALLLEQGEAEAGDLARAQGISVQAMRRQLRSRGAAGLVEASTSADGPGRPSNRWRLTNHGRRRFPMPATALPWGCSTPCELRCPRKPCANFSISRRKPRRSATGINSGRGPCPNGWNGWQRSAVKGYATHCAPDDDGRSWRLQELNCSVQRIAEEFPAVCDQELLLIRRAIPDCSVERVHWRLEKATPAAFASPAGELMAVDPEVVARIDATLLPQLDRHHLRLLVHCLDSFRTMASGGDGQLPDAASRRRWCEQQPVVVEDPSFLRSLLLQLDGAGRQLDELAQQLGKRPLELSVDDLITAAEARCHHRLQSGSIDDA